VRQTDLAQQQHCCTHGMHHMLCKQGAKSAYTHKHTHTHRLGLASFTNTNTSLLASMSVLEMVAPRARGVAGTCMRGYCWAVCSALTAPDAARS